MGIATVLPPFSEEAEQAVLGSILINPSVLNNIMLYVSAEDFFVPRHRYMFDAMVQLVAEGEEIDNITLGDKLKAIKRYDDVGGEGYIAQLLTNIPSTQHVESYANIVQRASARRLVMNLTEQLNRMAADTDKSIDELLTAFSDALDTTRTKLLERGLQPISSHLGKLLDKVELAMANKDKQAVSIPTGIDALDKMIGGYRKGKMYIIGGRTHNGKSSVIYTSAIAAARSGKRVAIYNTADGNEQTVMLMLIAIESGLSPSKIELGDLSASEYERLITAAGRLATLNIHVMSDKSMTPKQMLSHARAIRAKQGLDIIFVDYLQAMAGPPRMTDYERISIISKSMTKICEQLDVALVLAAQVNRAGGTGKAPELRHLEGSGKMEQDCQVGIIVHMEKLYNSDCKNPERMTLVVEKNKVTGQTGTVYARQNPISTGLTEWEGWIEDDTPQVIKNPMSSRYDKTRAGGGNGKWNA